MFSHSSHFKKIIALSTVVALCVMTLAPLTSVFAEGEDSNQSTPPPVVNESPTSDSVSPETASETPVDPTPSLETEEETTSPSTEASETSDTPPTEETASSTEPLTITASSTQTTVVDNEATSTSDTGNNLALLDEATTSATTTLSTATSTEVSVDTGDAVATANVVTAVNVSSYNSSGLILFLSSLLGGVGTIDFRNLGFMSAPTPTNTSTSSCSFVGCDSGLFTNILTDQNADITNTVTVGANTGGNTASGGDASVSTGNATAAANVVTVANSTFIDSNYVMVVFNQFGSWGNDVVLPGADAFGGLFGAVPAHSGSISATTNSSATVDTAVSVAANTGNNTASSTDGAATVETGNATAGATVVNTVNTSLIDSNAFVIIFRVHGNWSGSLFGLPPGVSWEQTPEGIALYSSPEGDTSSNPQSLTSSTTQNATIHNNIDVYALTGNNKAEGDSAHVSTGDATAAVNVVNIANSQVIGRNWLFAIVNIFGDWSGNIAFGRPDLWVAGSVDMPQNPARERDMLHYTLTLQNNGDADAHNTTFTVNLPDSLEYRSVDSGGTYATGTVSWQLGTLPPHTTRTVTLDVAITGHIPYGTSQSSITPHIHADEPDQNDQDNEDLISVDTFRPGPAPVSYTPAPTVNATPIPAITITKTAGAPSATASSTVSYHISLTNEAEGPAYDTVLFDTLRDPEGNIVFEKTWDIGDIAPHETIHVDYDVFFVGSSTPGLYSNAAYLKGLGGLPWSEPYNGFYITSHTATATIAINPYSISTQAPTRQMSKDTASSTITGTLYGKSLLSGPFSLDTPASSYGQIAALGFAADSRNVLALFPLFLALLAAAHYLSRTSEFGLGERRELILDFLRSHHLFFW